MGVLKEITISNPTDKYFSEYVLKINIVDSTIFDLLNDKNNILILSLDKKTLLPYYIDTFDKTNNNLILFVKLYNIEPYFNYNIYLYIDNYSNFDLFKLNDILYYYIDFSDVTIDDVDNEFTVDSTTDTSKFIDNGWLHLHLTSSNSASNYIKLTKNILFIKHTDLAIETNVMRITAYACNNCENTTYLLLNDSLNTFDMKFKTMDGNVTELLAYINSTSSLQYDRYDLNVPNHLLFYYYKDDNNNKIANIYRDDNLLLTSTVSNAGNTIINDFWIEVSAIYNGPYEYAYKYFKIYSLPLCNIKYSSTTIPYIFNVNHNIVLKSNVTISTLNSNIHSYNSKTYLENNIFDTNLSGYNSFVIHNTSQSSIISPLSYSNLLHVLPFTHFNDYSIKLSISQTQSLLNYISIKLLETQKNIYYSSILVDLKGVLNNLYSNYISLQRPIEKLDYINSMVLYLVQNNNTFNNKYYSQLLHISNSYFNYNFSNKFILNEILYDLYSITNKITNLISHKYYYSLKLTFSNLHFQYVYSLIIPYIQVLFTDYSMLIHEGRDMDIKDYSIDLYFKKMIFVDKIVRKYLIDINNDMLELIFNPNYGNEI